MTNDQASMTNGEPVWEVYSVNGRLMHRGTDEETARYGLATWPKAWTLLCDGVEIDINTRPNSEAGYRTPK